MSRLTLRTKFILIISAVFLISAASMLFVFSRVSGGIINDFAMRVASRQALHDKNKIMAILDREVVLALKLADDSVVRKWMAPGDDPALKKAALKQLESYRRFFRDQSYFVARSVDSSYFNADRTALPEQPRMSILRQDNPSDAWFYKTMRTLDTFQLNLDYNVLIRQIKVWINVIIRDEQGNKIGIGGTGIDLTDFLSEIVDASEPGVSAILVDRRGVIQAHRDRKLVERNALEQNPDNKTTIYKLLDNAEEAQQLKMALESLVNDRQKVVAFPLGIDGRKTFAALTFMPEIGWYNIALVDVSHALRPGAFSPIMLAGVLSLLAVITVIGFLMNRLVLHPLRLLTDASGAVAQGNYEVSLPVARRDEIGVLTESFNSMAATVREHTSHLEERVRQRTAELICANEQLEASQARIMESLLYARVIQASILPDPRRLGGVFSDWAVLYRPCDIVGGDLYWLREAAHGRVLLAVLDCTGHGVPGAFMTMTVNAVLNHIVDTRCADDPARILQEMNRLLQETLRLRQDDDSLVDAGLEIGLCCIDVEQRSLLFAGSGISLYLAEGDQIDEIKGNRQRVGYRGSDLEFVYQNHYRQLGHDTVCYMTTDGFLDEGGGPHGYGLGRARFREMLQQHRQVPLPLRMTAFERLIDDWRGARKQRDDITVFGFRL